MPNLPEQILTRPEELAACCEHLASCRRFGFDTEFVGEESYHPRLCLVQVATAQRLLLIDPLTVGPLDAFWQLVVDPANQVVVHAGREEARLCRLWTGRTPGNLFDLQIAAGLVGLAYPLGHAALVRQLLGIPLAKAETLTEWRDRPLTPQQVRYAFDDVRYLLPLADQLADRLRQRGRETWAREEFDRLAATAAPLPSAGESAGLPEKWRKLRGLGSLDRRRLAIVRELSRWREETAARTNRPARSLIRDDLLIEIARRNPNCERDLHGIRGLPHRNLAAIVAAVQRARELPLEQCPAVSEREQDPPQVAFVTGVLLAVLGNFCASQGLAPNLVASTQDIRLLVRARLECEQARQREPGAAEDQPEPLASVAAEVLALPPASPLAQGWRRVHILPELLAVLEGRRSLRLRDVTAEAPFTIE